MKDDDNAPQMVYGRIHYLVGDLHMGINGGYVVDVPMCCVSVAHYSEDVNGAIHLLDGD